MRWFSGPGRNGESYPVATCGEVAFRYIKGGDSPENGEGSVSAGRFTERACGQQVGLEQALGLSGRSLPS